MPPTFLNDDPLFDFNLLRPLSLSVYDGSDIGEVLMAARNIIPGDFESFSSAFLQLANKVCNRAASIVKSDFPFSARTALFSAATYFRSADFFLHGNSTDVRVVDYWHRQTDAFDQAISLLNPPGKRLTIRTPDFDVPATWYTPAGQHARQLPTIIMGNGYDGSQEELYHVIGAAAIERGYNVLTYEGPGQPAVIRQQGLGFIPDWERVVTPVMDYVLQHMDNVDPDSVGLLGLSFGGYLAPRAAAFDHRFAAVIALDGVWDFGATTRSGFGTEMLKLHASGNRQEFDKRARSAFLRPGTPTHLRWGLEQGLWAFRTQSPFDLVVQAANYTLEHVAHLIKTPTFIGDAQRDLFFGGQPRRLAEALGSWGHLHEFKVADGTGMHSGIGALKQQSQVVLDWFQHVVDERQDTRRRHFYGVSVNGKSIRDL
ncbi:hypothetical protein HIM_07326 [Hirsutella minnesotensis 3608]|uniref:Peptidase S9 prolyl oligopeptidase catalytic domain-containing protein n=1 Tax=Hirsutella minnesotensis 3608 TaxID=1043627 RepID=A0A0F7ZYZ3_9HYPO|nr:hypothetical protein HIM_07326 [Hirsutella minnesotensis 3608]